MTATPSDVVAYDTDHPDVIAQATRMGSDPASVAKAMRLSAATREAAALKQWQRTGEGERPSTPNLNSIKEGITMKSATKSRSNGGGGRIAVTKQVEYIKNGERIVTKHDLSLGYIAVTCTAGISKSSPKRVGVKELEAILAKLGVSDPRQPFESVTLPNGVVLGGIVPGAPLPKVTLPKPVEKATATKSTTTTKAATPKAKQVAKSTAGPVLPVLDDLMKSIDPKRTPAKSSARKSTATKKVAAK